MSLGDWLFAKRMEAQRLHLPAYREWINQGARPAPVYGRGE